MQFCNVIIYSYHYLLDPKIAERVSKDFPSESIIVFDEAHNIDNVCIESLSTDITDDSLRRATRGVENLQRKVAEVRDADQQRLQDEYEKLVEGLRDANDARQEDAFMANPGMSVQSPLAGLPENPVCALLEDVAADSCSCFSSSAAGRFAEGGCAWKHSQSGPFCGLLEALH
jgi:DNA excision repair protein ERCC-2